MTLLFIRYVTIFRFFVGLIILATTYADADLRPSLTWEIDRLLQRKIAGDELDKEAKITVINDFLEQQIEHFAASVHGMATNEVEEKHLDVLFRMTLWKVWENCYEKP